MYRRFFKRFFDIVFSFVLLVLLALPMTLLSLLILVVDRGAPIFCQRRFGKEKKLFVLYKFRSMKKDTPELPTHLLADPDKYMLPFGSFLRRSSLDELPQLFNILKGEMSFVGPRPALWNQDDLIALRDTCCANLLRPGLTGLAQVSGRDELSISKKAELDGQYAKAIIDGKGLKMDLTCLFKTLFSVFY